eukprot:Hpha_TRINITY_DN35713_c0_g1::TRINITY_DN35713_c0_g1_i1::g.139907::m.139907
MTDIGRTPASLELTQTRSLGGTAARMSLPGGGKSVTLSAPPNRDKEPDASESLADMTMGDLVAISEYRAGMTLEGSALHIAWKQRMQELGLSDELDLEQFRALWL